MVDKGFMLLGFVAAMNAFAGLRFSVRRYGGGGGGGGGGN